VQNMTILEFLDMENEKSFQFDNKNKISISKNLENFKYIRNGQEFPFKLSYKYYISKYESGHYIFTPDGITSKGSIPYAMPEKASVLEGDLLTQITVY